MTSDRNILRPPRLGVDWEGNLKAPAEAGAIVNAHLVMLYHPAFRAMTFVRSCCHRKTP
jgi:hypothetical protein